MKKKKKRHRRVRYFRVFSALVLLILIIWGIAKACSSGRNESKQTAANQVLTTAVQTTTTVVIETTTEEPTLPTMAYPVSGTGVKAFGDEYDVKNAVLIDVDSNTIVADKNSSARMYPASLTKVMTLIVAVENTPDLNEKVEITNEIVAEMIDSLASRAGYEAGETPSMLDALYGMILTSGGDATLSIANHVAGSETAFVELMNNKAQEMGLKSTHFTNTVGLHDDNHYSTAQDMALILEYAMKNDVCRKILSTAEYTSEVSSMREEPLVFESTVFARMYGDEMPNVKVLGGKTGFTDQAGNCVETFAVINGKTYILVLCGATTRWNTIYNTLSAYSVMCAGGQPYDPPV